MMEEDPQLISVYVDGASRGNPGPAGVGIIIRDGSKKVLKRFSKSVGTSTNNVAEYLALIYGLQEALLMGAKRIALYSDSELITKQVNREYKAKDKKLLPFFGIAMHLIDNLPGLEIKYIDRKENIEADRLANEAIESLF